MLNNALQSKQAKQGVASVARSAQACEWMFFEARSPAEKMASKPRGEVAELGGLLQSLCVVGKKSEKDQRPAKKEAFKKVINYMTLGMDLSPLFPMMTSVANLSPDDIVLKKMLYLYITHYASQAPDLALLAINQLTKDCSDQDPTVRGLALRSLCSLRVPNFMEYVLAPINAGLRDRHPYVRRTAVMGVLKLLHANADTATQAGMLDAVQAMLYADPDSQVVANCLSVLLETEGAGKLVGDKKLIYGLINKLKDFSDWSQCQVGMMCCAQCAWLGRPTHLKKPSQLPQRRQPGQCPPHCTATAPYPFIPISHSPFLLPLLSCFT